MQFQQNAGLPVSPMQLNPAAAQNMQGLPHRPPFTFQLQVINPQTQQIVPSVIGFTLVEILNASGKNPLRTFFANYMSDQNWQNQNFFNVTQEVCLMTEYLMMTQRMAPEQAMQSAAGEIVMIKLAQLSLQYVNQGLTQFVTPDLSGQLDAALGRGQQWENAKGQWLANMQAGQQSYNQYQQQQYGAPMGANTPQWAMGANVGGGYPPRQMGQQNRQPYQSPYAGGTNVAQFTQQARFTPLVAGAAVGPGLKPRVRPTDTNVELSMSPSGSREVKLWNSAEGQLEAEVNQARKLPEIKPFQYESTAINSIDSMPMDSQTSFTNAAVPGEEKRLASESGWQVTYSVENPYRTIFNPETHVLYHVRHADGRVTELLEAKDDSMDYSQHELNPNLRRQVAAQKSAEQPKIVPQWHLANSLRQVNSKYAVSTPSADGEMTVDTSDDVKSGELDIRQDIIQVHSMREVELKMNLFSKSANKDGPSVIEAHFDIIDPVTTEKNLTDLMAGLKNSETFYMLRLRMAELGDELPDDVRKYIDTRLTKSINQAMERNLGLIGWKIDSFEEDYEDLVKALKASWGQLLVDNFENLGEWMISQSLDYLEGESYANYLKLIEVANEDFAYNVLAFRTRVSMTQVPWKFDDLKLDLNNGGLIPESSMPELFAAAEQIFERSEDMPVTYTHRYLQTADGQMLELRKGFLAEGAYLLYLA